MMVLVAEPVEAVVPRETEVVQVDRPMAVRYWVVG